MNKTTIEITDNNFQQLLQQNETVVVDFWAEWCGPCRAIGPIIDQLSEAYKGKAVIGKINVDEQKETAAIFDITSIPSILFFKDGKLRDTVKGSVPRYILETRLQALLAS